MLTDEELPPLPMFESTHARPDGIVTLYREEEILEWGRAVEQAAYAAAIKACENEQVDAASSGSHLDVIYNNAVNDCIDAIRALMQEQPK